MSDFKYEVGDRFDCEYNEREIVAAFMGSNNLPRYVVRGGDIDMVRTEAYIDKYYTKIEPFFEVGKLYYDDISRYTYTCVYVDEVSSGKYAALRRFYKDGVTPAYLFSKNVEKYTEVK